MKLFYILTFILFLSVSAHSQSRLALSPDPAVRILKFYPNPATSQITFTFNTDYSKELSFQIFNFIGKKVYEVQSLSPTTSVNLNDFYRGVYIFQLRDKSGKIIETGKFQKAE